MLAELVLKKPIGTPCQTEDPPFQAQRRPETLSRQLLFQAADTRSKIADHILIKPTDGSFESLDLFRIDCKELELSDTG